MHSVKSLYRLITDRQARRVRQGWRPWWLYLACWAVILVMAADCHAQGSDARAVMDQLRARFDNVDAFSATFHQSLDAAFAGSPSTLSGRIILSGDRYRITTSGQTIVTDGVTSWVYLIEDNQVIVSDYLEDEAAFTPGHFLDERTERYDASFAEEQADGHHVVLLTARSAETYIESATLWISKDDFVISRLDVIDVNGAAIKFEMTDIDLEPEISDDTFQFVIPDGVEVVDLRS